MHIQDIQILPLKKKELNRHLIGLLECLSSFGPTHLSRQHAHLLFDAKKKLGHITLIAVYMDRCIGTATLVIEPKYLRNGSIIGHIEDVAVLENFRKLGVGKLLIDELCEYARRANCYKVILDCADHNISFYEGCGFRKHENCMRIDL